MDTFNNGNHSKQNRFSSLALSEVCASLLSFLLLFLHFSLYLITCSRGTFIDWTTKIGHTPLTWACVCRLPEMVKELLILGADPNLAATIRVTRSNNDDEKAQSKTKFKRERVLGQTPLHYACIQGSSEITESLIQRIRDLCIMESLTNNKWVFYSFLLLLF